MQTTRKAVAIKTVSRSILTHKLLENLESEIAILKALRHKNITELTDIVVSNLVIVAPTWSLLRLQCKGRGPPLRSFRVDPYFPLARLGLESKSPHLPGHGVLFRRRSVKVHSPSW